MLISRAFGATRAAHAAVWSLFADALTVRVAVDTDLVVAVMGASGAVTALEAVLLTAAHHQVADRLGSAVGIRGALDAALQFRVALGQLGVATLLVDDALETDPGAGVAVQLGVATVGVRGASSRRRLVSRRIRGGAARCRRGVRLGRGRRRRGVGLCAGAFGWRGRHDGVIVRGRLVGLWRWKGRLLTGVGHVEFEATVATG